MAPASRVGLIETCKDNQKDDAPYEVVRHTGKVFRFTGSWCSVGLWKGQNFKTSGLHDAAMGSKSTPLGGGFDPSPGPSLDSLCPHAA